MQIISLITDFGTKDYYTAVLKASILKRSKDVQIIDISHSVSVHDIVEGAFFLNNSYSQFPAGSIHVVAIQNYDPDRKRMIVFERDGYFFIGPNNGLFSLVFKNLEVCKIYEINVEDKNFPFLHEIISHAVACISHGLPLEEIGPQLMEIESKLGLQPVTTGTQIRATIIHIDHFGNVIVNLTRDVFDKVCKKRPFEIYYKGSEPIFQISHYYNDVAIGDVLCMFNSAGYLEIAINMGNAHEMLSLKKNETIQIDFINN